MGNQISSGFVNPVRAFAVPTIRAETANENQKPPSDCPMHASDQSKDAKEAQAEWVSECPSNPDAASGPSKTSDVDPLNMMPPPNQRPSPDQPFLLSTDRQKSTIPKATAPGETWVYPSAQMFWNAMLRKGWRWTDEEGISEETMNHIIHIHNNNNEA